MTIEYAWKIEQMERKPDTGLVTVVHYRVTATDGDLVADVYGTLSMEPGETFIPFEQLTQRDVISWVQHALDKTTVEDSLRSRIELLRTPPVVSGLPWTN